MTANSNIRIRIGQLIDICGQTYRVAERQRGRAGEERNMYVLEKKNAVGEWYRAETRCRTSLLRHLKEA